MAEGRIEVYTGIGKGKSSAAMGRALKAASEGQSVSMIHFMKGKTGSDSEFIRRLEPEIKSFRFEKSNENFEQLSEERKREEIQNLQNGLGFARKVLATGECDLLVLDEVLGVIENEIISLQEFLQILENRGQTDIILTGICLQDEICQMADVVSFIQPLK
ncbi:MAG: cob(I)yrinic acid a,c-diamide adenosyltransferase [Clostridium sp.]|jgi:cob(I)alamin adenosyltransferase|nr:cob(I)yrinic acid a,c-diamide adenosyltransferase [Clostridium sp.]